MKSLRNFCGVVIAIGFIATSINIQAQVIPADAVVTVNGVPISEAMYQQNLAANIAQGTKDTPQLRQAVREELINRELMAQQAEKLGLDKTPQAKLQLKQIRENALVEMLLTNYMQAHPITEEDIHVDYLRQINLLRESGNVQQYQLSVIIVASQNEADDVIDKLRLGMPFATLARDKSIDPSKTQGGVVGWVLPNQVNPALADIMTNLNKGSFSGPIPTSVGWNIIKVDGKRPFQVPSYEDSKAGIIQLLIQQRRAELINQLRAASSIVQPTASGI